jgi:hypothetical protein
MNEDNELITTEQSTVLSVAPKSADAIAVRVAKEVEGAMIVAKKFPRDEFACIDRIKRSFQRQRLAEAADYEFPRGGQKIVGASVHALRAIKAAWGNIQSGWMEVDRKPGISTVICYAMDLETNARAEVTFQVKHIRDTKSGGRQLTEERDIYEHVANMAARRERKCLEDIIPADVIDEAIDQARVTMRGNVKEPLADRVRKMVSAFGELGVTIDMLEGRLGHKLSALSENQFAGLRRVFQSLRDGVGERKDYFEVELPSGKNGTSDLAAKARDMAAKDKATLGKTGEPASAPAAAETVEFTPQAEWEQRIMEAGTLEDVTELVRQATDEGFGVGEAGERRKVQLDAEKPRRGERANKQRSLPGE